MTATHPEIRGKVETTVVYLEMTSPPDRPPTAPPPPGVEVRRALRPTGSFFRYLSDTIGAEWTWTARRLMSDAELVDIIRAPMVELNILWIDGVPAGLAEIDRRASPDLELSYFGLIPDFVGKGLGGFFLNWAIDHAWTAGPRRLWVHTCDLDHPNALPVYRRAGFQVYDRQKAYEVTLEGMPPPKRAGQVVDIERILKP
ncbi:MAG: GNAT family N-acetyltransferase [Geminicoccaceae bacterium]